MAKNIVYDKAVEIPLIVTNAPNDPAESGDPVLCGAIPGVALIDADDTQANEGVATFKTDGAARLAVVGNDGVAAEVSPGDIVYYNTTNDTLDINNAGTRFGYAMESVASGATTTIKVKVGY